MSSVLDALNGSCETVRDAFPVLLPVIGVLGDGRTYEDIVSLRAMTLDPRHDCGLLSLRMKFLGNAATHIIDEVKGVK